MANQIVYTNINPVRSGLLTVSSRYANNKVIQYGANGYLTLTTYVRTPYKPSTQDKRAVVPAGMEYRPDLISNQAYGAPDFWWRIMEANNMMDLMDFKAGTNIVIPAAAF